MSFKSTIPFRFYTNVYINNLFSNIDNLLAQINYMSYINLLSSE